MHASLREHILPRLSEEGVIDSDNVNAVTLSDSNSSMNPSVCELHEGDNAQGTAACSER
jgi:hypothetical protein